MLNETDFIQRAERAFDPKLNFRQNTLAIAWSQMGVHEQGGDNQGPEVHAYQRAAGIRAGDPWCAAYVNWCAEQTARLLGYKSPLEEVKYQGSCQSIFEWAEHRGLIVPASAALPGDLFLLWFPSLGRHGHVGFNVARGTRTFSTAEGNSNDEHSREGKEVCSNLRNLTSRVKFVRWTRTVVKA